MLQDISLRELYESLAKRRPGKEKQLILMTGGAYAQATRDFIATLPNVLIEKPFDIEVVVANSLRR
jgi:two-component system, cell cycle sensor histidine kinase and response regulator CckA